MPLIMVGYGDYAEYLLRQLPLEVLEELATRYPLTLSEQYSSEYDDLAITVALHGEINRRRTGGQQERHTPSRRELGQSIVKKGFQQASKQHHPDGDGHHEAQVRLSEVRDELLAACESLSNDRSENAIIIPPPPVKAAPLRPRAAKDVFSDDDVPF
jgi:hypothetical protein